MPNDVTSKILSAERRAEIEARLKAASPGPWQLCGENRKVGEVSNSLLGKYTIIESMVPCGCGLVWSIPVDLCVAFADTSCEEEGIKLSRETINNNGMFIAHAPTDIAALLDSHRALAEKVKQLESVCDSLSMSLSAATEARRDK